MVAYFYYLPDAQRKIINHFHESEIDKNFPPTLQSTMDEEYSIEKMGKNIKNKRVVGREWQKGTALLTD